MIAMMRNRINQIRNDDQARDRNEIIQVMENHMERLERLEQEAANGKLHFSVHVKLV